MENLLKENFVKVCPIYTIKTCAKFVSFDHTNLDLPVTIFLIHVLCLHMILIGMMFRLVNSHQSPSKVFLKVFNAGLHEQRTLSKKTLIKFLMENFDCVN
jgi:hypothetical protein